ncbi:hypothetical protein GJ698_22135 [Pseudoduganella sp. FT26W]|uniref:Uncharacterized protein n=1 Tax=Duganella aquatilis TaxID=2666082 RepID=A0A844DFG4_9BURK|nr:hypothetical protein [Duganella aquatilis]MRW86774.1 hypothetical protein [Duganella aquatilis]
MIQDIQPAGFHVAFYKGTRPGLSGIYSRAVRGWEGGRYSHCELVFSDGVSASASFVDGGVRFKRIEYDPANWEYLPLPAALEGEARQWFAEHEGEAYDILGNVHFVIGFVPQARRKKFCSEAVGAALGVPDAWRFGPNALSALLLYLVDPPPPSPWRLVPAAAN